MARKAFGQFKLEEGLEIVVGAIDADCTRNGWELDARTIALVLGEKCGYDANKNRTLTCAVYGWLTEEVDYEVGKRRDVLLARVIKKVLSYRQCRSAYSGAY